MRGEIVCNVMNGPLKRNGGGIDQLEFNGHPRPVGPQKKNLAVIFPLLRGAASVFVGFLMTPGFHLFFLDSRFTTPLNCMSLELLLYLPVLLDIFLDATLGFDEGKGRFTVSFRSHVDVFIIFSQGGKIASFHHVHTHL